MRKSAMFLMLPLFCAVAGAQCNTPGAEYRRLSMNEYLDKMKAAWVGQMAGVGWGGPTEFNFNGVVIPEDKMPGWEPGMINQFHQDDIYVEMTFVRTLEEHGWDVDIRQAGIDFANSGYPLWHANKFGRKNLRAGVAPPDSGHPQFNGHADDIDYQIEADFSGIIAPGMPALAVELGEKFGRLMNYGDGLYGGQFVGGMYSAAFFETDIEKIIEAGLACIPKDSQYHECVSDVLRWYREDSENWTATWEKINEKYHLNPECRKFSCGTKDGFNIDAKLNGAYIVMGLLYGKGDPDQTIIISTRCGQGSDCNPSNAAGVLFTSMGMSKIPEKFTSELKDNVKFTHTDYDFDGLIKVCAKLVREAVLLEGGCIENSEKDGEMLVIPVRQPKPGPIEQCWAPGPIADSKFTPEEMAKITGKDEE
ncbi:MAG: ADP-ribosylglycohydrolase family protein [Candidatus Hydrogenedentes bacterium]|nr:ADP-ribosylglycohydrolase family protein [Candidatus Hydrogenedentota bacterium]